ncbi:unnamed protein product [Amoebophrya sp. A25]|nr:unnamed protein product [Amoebophrya sp. A25]|eukprot:GSA25T00023144001.1
MAEPNKTSLKAQFGLPTDRYQKLCIYNTQGHNDKVQITDVVIQVRSVPLKEDDVVDEDFEVQPKKQPDGMSMRNNPEQIQYFPFPKHFRRKVAEIDMTKNYEISLLRVLPDSVKFDPDRLTTESAGEKRRFPTSGVEVAFSQVPKKEVFIPEDIAARQRYLDEHELVALFDNMYEFLMREKPILPKEALANYLFKAFEFERIEQDRKNRRGRFEAGDMESKIKIPKPPTKVIEYKLEDERKRQEQKDRKTMKIDLLHQEEREILEAAQAEAERRAEYMEGRPLGSTKGGDIVGRSLFDGSREHPHRQVTINTSGAEGG